MPTISIKVENRRASQAGGDEYVCGNSDYTVAFVFDAEWDAYTNKTARFSYGGHYQEVLFTGNTCTMPRISDTSRIQIGVYAGDLRTTTAAIVQAKPSILCGSGTHEDPPEDVYNQIMQRIEEIEGASPEAIAEAVNAYMEENPVQQMTAGDNIQIVGNTVSVLTTNEAEADNTRPITSAGVATQIGNIEILLATI